MRRARGRTRWAVSCDSSAVCDNWHDFTGDVNSQGTLLGSPSLSKTDPKTCTCCNLLSAIESTRCSADAALELEVLVTCM